MCVCDLDILCCSNHLVSVVSYGVIVISYRKYCASQENNVIQNSSGSFLLKVYKLTTTTTKGRKRMRDSKKTRYGHVSSYEKNLVLVLRNLTMQVQQYCPGPAP